MGLGITAFRQGIEGSDETFNGTASVTAQITADLGEDGGDTAIVTFNPSLSAAATDGYNSGGFLLPGAATLKASGSVSATAGGQPLSLASNSFSESRGQDSHSSNPAVPALSSVGGSFTMSVSLNGTAAAKGIFFSGAGVFATVSTLDLQATSLTLDPKTGNLNYAFAVSPTGNFPYLPGNLTLGFYWVTPQGLTPAYQTAVSNPPIGSSQGSLAANLLNPEPAGATALEMVVDPNHVYQEVDHSDDTNNTQVLQLQPETVTPTQPAWDLIKGGFDYGYQVSGSGLLPPVPVAFYWAPGTTVPAGATPFYTTTTQTTAGSFGPIDIPSTQMTTPPAGTNYLLEVTDPQNVLPGDDGVSNVRALPVPTMSKMVTGAVSAFTNMSPRANPNIDPGQIYAYFQPNIVTLDTAAKLGGFDHFNWLQFVRYTPHSPIGTLPFLDPPPVLPSGGIAGPAFFRGHWVDAFDFYYNEPSTVSMNLVDNVLYHTHGFNPQTSGLNAPNYWLDFFDRPDLGLVALVGGHTDFTTELVGVSADSRRRRVLFGFEWSSNFNSKTGLGGVQFGGPQSGSSSEGGIYNLQSGLSPLPASDLVVSAPGGDVVAGSPFAVTVYALDAQGLVDPNYNGSVTLALAANPGHSSLGGTLTVNAVNGVAVFSGLTLNNPGAGYSLTASAGSLGPGSSSPFDAVSDQLVVTTAPPAAVTAGSPFSFVVTAEDGAGKTNAGFSGPVTVAAPAGASVGGTLTVSAVNGVATFSGLTLTRPGTQGLLVTAAGTAAATLNVAVTPAPATQLVVTAPPPANVTAGSGFGLQISAEDPYGNVDPSFTGSVSLALGTNPGNATLGGTTGLSATNGVANFTGLTIGTLANGYTLRATATGLTAASTGAVNVVSPGVATRLVVISEPPSQVAAGSGFGFAVAAEDALGTVDASYGGTVTVALAANASGGGTLGGTLSAKAVNGVATFSDLSLDLPLPGYTLQVSATGLEPATTTSIDVISAPAATPSWLPAVARELTHSPEYYTTFITAAYQRYLGRPPDAAGLASWLARMQAGLTDEQLEAALIGSPEYIAAHGGPGAGWVRGMYQDLLGRSASPAEVDAWVNALTSGAATTTEVAYGFAAGPEREAERVTQDYLNFLGRTPGPAEVAGWVNAFESHALTNEDVLAGFSGSGEFFQGHSADPTDWFSGVHQALFGRAASSSASLPGYLAAVAHDLTHSAEYYTGVITAAYRRYLGRPPDAAGLASWLARMQAGLTDEQLEAAFIGSPEYVQDHGGPGAGWVTGLYQDLLGRTPGQAEVQGWLQALANGATPAQVAYGFAAGPEREAERVTQDYLTFLGRTPNSAEVAGWVNGFESHLLTNEDVIAGFIGSGEFFADSGGTALFWWQGAVQALFAGGPSA